MLSLQQEGELGVKRLLGSALNHVPNPPYKSTEGFQHNMQVYDDTPTSRRGKKKEEEDDD